MKTETWVFCVKTSEVKCVHQKNSCFTYKDCPEITCNSLSVYKQNQGSKHLDITKTDIG